MRFPKICGHLFLRKNPADAKTLELLRARGIETFETKDGNVTVISDGNHLEIRQELER